MAKGVCAICTIYEFPITAEFSEEGYVMPRWLNVQRRENSHQLVLAS